MAKARDTDDPASGADEGRETGPAAAKGPESPDIGPARRALIEQRRAEARKRRSVRRNEDARVPAPIPAEASPLDDEDDDDDEFPRPLPVVRDQPGPPATVAEGGEPPAPDLPAERVVPIARPVVYKPPRRRRWPLVLSFLLMVALPTFLAVRYLYTQTADQFHSVVAFSVRSEDPLSTVADASALSTLGFTGALDSVILDEFIQSQQLVETLDRDVGLREIYNRRPEDWVFTFGEDRSIEDLVRHWGFMVDVDYDITTSLLQITAYAFTPEDARRITEGVLVESTKLVNKLSAEAREDAIRFAKRDVDEAEQRLKEIRLKLREFRDRTQTADPSKDVEIQMGVILALQQALAEALISRAELLDFAREKDPRVAEAERRIKAIEDQIAAEKTKLGTGGIEGSQSVLADAIGTFEELKTDLGFAEQAYVAAQATFDLARIEARRQSRYLAVHIDPTLSQAPQYPQRLLLSFGSFGTLLVVWGVLALVVVNLRDRR